MPDDEKRKQQKQLFLQSLQKQIGNFGKKTVTPEISNYSDVLEEERPTNGNVLRQTKNGNGNFDNWYNTIATRTGIDKNPDNPLHKFDYRKYYDKYAKGRESEWLKDAENRLAENPDAHLFSDFKTEDHPTKYKDLWTPEQIEAEEDSLKQQNVLGTPLLKKQPFKIEDTTAISESTKQPIKKELGLKPLTPEQEEEGKQKLLQGLATEKERRDTELNPLTGLPESMVNLEGVPRSDPFVNAINTVVSSGLRTIPGTIEALGLIGDELLRSGITGETPGASLLPPSETISKLTSKVGKGLRETIETKLPIDEKRKGFVESTLPSAIGSGLGFLIGGSVGKLAKVPTFVSTLLLSTSQAAEEYNVALQQTGDRDKAYQVFIGNLPFAATEVLPFERLFRRLEKFGGLKGKELIIEMLSQGSVEGVQEQIQQFGANLTAQQIYDAQRELSEGTNEGGLAGFITGMFLSGLGNVAARQLNEGIPNEESKLLTKSLDEINKQRNKVDELVRESLTPGNKIAKDYFKQKETEGEIKKPEIPGERISPQDYLKKILTSAPEETANLPSLDELNQIKNLASRIAEGQSKFTTEDLQLQSNFKTQLEEELNSFKSEREIKREQRQLQKQRLKVDTDTYSELSRQFKSARRKRNAFDTDAMLETVNNISTTEIKTKANELLKEAISNNERLIKRNEFTLENLSQKKFGTQNINSLEPDKQQQLINEYNSMKAQGIKTFKDIETIKPIIKTQEVTNANRIREQAEEIRKQKEVEQKEEEQIYLRNPPQNRLETGRGEGITEGKNEEEIAETQITPEVKNVQEKPIEAGKENIQEVSSIEKLEQKTPDSETVEVSEGVKKPYEVEYYDKFGDKKTHVEKFDDLESAKKFWEGQVGNGNSAKINYPDLQKKEVKPVEEKKEETGKYLVYDMFGNIRSQETDVNEATRKAVKLGGHYKEVMTTPEGEKFSYKQGETIYWRDKNNEIIEGKVRNDYSHKLDKGILDVVSYPEGSRVGKIEKVRLENASKVKEDIEHQRPKEKLKPVAYLQTQSQYATKPSPGKYPAIEANFGTVPMTFDGDKAREHQKLVGEAIKENKITEKEYNELHSKDYGKWGSEEFNENFGTKPESKIKQKIKSIENNELKDALDDFLTSFDLKSGIDPIQLAKGVKVISVYVKLGTYKFADITTDLYSKIGDKLEEIFDALKQAYSAYRETAGDDIYEKMDSSTRGITYGSIKPKEESENLQLKLVDAIYKRIEERGIKDNPELNRIADEVYGGSKAQGKYTSQDAYNALETAVNRLISEKYSDILDVDVKEALKDLRDLIKNIPTQTSRTQDKDLLQQFSTPPTLSYFANKLLNANENDILLEPSAGTGNLIAFQKNRVKKIYVNEIDPKRKELLEAEGYETNDIDAEFLNSMLPKEIIPTKIIMNPPFSATGGRVKQNSNKFGYKHLTSALQRLKDGGRLVAILGEGAEFGRPESSKLFWDKVVDNYTVKADIGVENTDYGKYGTSFGNRIIVIDKTGATPEINGIRRPELQGNYKTIEEALNAADNIISSAPGTLADDSENVSLAERSQGTGTQGTTGRGGKVERGSESISPGFTKPGRQGDIEETELQSGRTGRNVSSIERQVGGQRIESGGTEESGRSDTERTRNLVEYEESDISEREEEKSGFIEYKPKQKPKGSQSHPAKLVESASMAAVEAPTIIYKPDLPEESITEGKISDAQLETIAYAGQRHKLMLSNGSRAGFFVGDGTGVGKGRIIAGILHDNFRQGRKKALWVSVSTDLQKDARRDLDGVGAEEIKSILINDYKLGESIPKDYNGVVFSTYSSLISGKDEATRIKQIVEWLGKDGVIVFDEAHKAKNILAAGRSGKPTKTAEAVVDLQETHLPKARVVYASATGATDVKHMGYMTRLGLWGEGAPFSAFLDFMTEIERGGIGAMEMVARDLKALGMYSSRSISFDGIEYEESEHILTNEQRRMYDTAAKAWQVVMQNIDQALDMTGNDNNAKRWAYSAFWGSHQRFFKQFITALKVPTLIKEVEKNLAGNKSVVISMIGTHEASTSRAVTEKLAEGGDLDDLDLSPREVLANLVDRAFPIIDYEQYTDDNGNLKSRPKKDKNGNSVTNPEAQKLKDKLLEKLSDINLPENPLDQIINYFELESHNRNDRALRVAELTGRKKRLVKEVIKNPDPNAKDKYIFGGKTRYDKRVPKDIRAKDTNIYEMQQFQTGKKRIALISQAASTGISLHADKNTPNSQRRTQIALELSWSADTQMQTFGRTHRSNQEIPPIYILLSSEVGGEKRFSSTIAKRLASLGALTKGERGGAGGGQLAKYDFENEYGETALVKVYEAMLNEAAIEGIENPKQVLRDMGVLKNDPTGGEGVKDEDMKSITMFLNRILGLELGKQNALFDFFTEQFENVVINAKESGTYDEGVTDIKAESIKIVGKPKIVATEPLTKAETKHFQLEVERKTDPLNWNVAKQMRNINDKRGFFKQINSGNVILKMDEKVKTDRITGAVERTVITLNPANNRNYVTHDEFEEKYERINESEARPIWEERFDKVPKIKKDEMHIISGAILPLWKDLKQATGNEKLRVVRALTDSKQRVVGIQIPQSEVGKVLRALNVQRDLRTSEEIFNAVLEQGDKIDLVQGLQLKQTTLYGDDAIELVGKGDLGLDSNRFDEFRELGLLNERISYKQRFFVPSDPDTGIETLTNLLKRYPATKEGGSGETQTVTPSEDESFISDRLYKQSQDNIADSLGNLTANFDPTLIKDYAVIGAYHLERLFKKAGEKADVYLPWIKAMVKDFGNGIRRFLRSIWREAKLILSGEKPILNQNVLASIGGGEINIPGDSKIPSNNTNQTGSEKARSNGNEEFEGNIEDTNASDLFLSSEDMPDNINAAMKNITNREVTEIALGVGRDKFTRFKKWAKRYFDQGTQPPVYMADKSPIYRAIYDVTEKYYVRDFTRDYNKILEDKQGLNKFNDFRKLSSEDQEGLLDALRDYHEKVLYNPSENWELEGHAETIMEFISDYKLNPDQTNALKKMSGAYDKGLELIKDGEKIFLRDHVKDIFTARTSEGSKYISVAKFKKELPAIYKEIKKALDEVSAEVNEDSLDVIWNQNKKLRTELGNFLVEEKYHDYGQYLYINLSRPLTQDSIIIGAKKEAKDSYGETYTDKRFTYFNSEIDAKKYKKAAIDLGWTVTMEGRVKDVINDANVRKELGMMELIRLLEDSAIELPSSDIEELFKSIKARGWSKHTIQRNYTPGLKWTTEELETNLKNYLHEASTAKNKFLGIIKADELYENWFEGVNEKIKSPNVSTAQKEELKTQAKWLQKYLAGMRSSDRTVMDTVRGITAIWRLGFAKASFLTQQALQNFQMALPLAQAEVGFNQANGIFINAMEDTTKLGLHFALEKINKHDSLKINPELLNLVKEARLMRKISAIGTQEFFGASDPSIYYSGPVKKLFNRISFVARALSSGIEILTRLHSAVMFFKIGKQKEFSGEKLEKYVIDNLDKAMGEYGKGGRIVIFNPSKKENLNTGHFRRAVAKSYIVFKTFATHNLGLWRMLIRNKNYGPLFTKFAVGVGLHGIRKFPFYSTLFLLAGLFFDDDDQELDYEAQKLENEINDKVGGRLGSLLNRGIGTYANVDISDLMGEQAPIPTESAKYSKVYGNDFSAWSARIVEGAFGAPYGTADDFFKATGGSYKLLEEKIKDEETLTDRQRETALKNLRRFTPDFLKNILNSMTYQKDGIEFRGKQIISDKDLTSYELLLKALSFTPEKVSMAYEKANVKNESSTGRTGTGRTRENRIRQTRERSVRERN